MANATQSEGRPKLFVDTLDTLLVYCRSEDPSTAIACRLDTAYGIIASLILPIVMLAGFFGNGMTAYIYLWKLRPLTRQGVYFAATAIADNCSMFISGVIWTYLAKGLTWISGARAGYIIVNDSDMACRLFRFFEPLFNLSSISLFLVMLTDRCLSVHYPFRFQRVTAKTAMKACAITILADTAVTVLFCVPFQWVVIGNYIACSYSLVGWQYLVYTLFVMMVFSPGVLFFLAIFVANGFLIRKLRQIASEQAELRAQVRGPVDNKLTSTVICVVLSIVFIATSFPVVCYSMGTIFTSLVANDLLKIFNDLNVRKAFSFGSAIGRILQICNHSVNWIILFWKSAQYRETFLSALRVSRRPAGPRVLQLQVAVAHAADGGK